MQRATTISVREAGPRDNAALLDLARATPMPGSISLRLDRDPDFFALPRWRGKSTVFLAEGGSGIQACVSLSERTLRVRGMPRRAAYLADLRVHPNFRGGRAGLLLARALSSHCLHAGIGLAYGLVAGGNDTVLGFLSGKSGLPAFQPMGVFEVSELLPAWTEGGTGAYTIRELGPGDYEEGLEWWRSRREHYAWSTEWGAMEFETSRLLFKRRLWTASQGGRIRAILGCVDTASARRNVVMHIPAAVNLALKAASFVQKPWGLWEAPTVGSPIRMLYAWPYACDGGHKRAFRALLRRLRFVARLERYSFVSLGLHREDPLAEALRGIPEFTFQSRIFASDLGGGGSDLQSWAGGACLEDYSLV